jgi:3-methyladenine DNA glycosylase AlkD
MKFFIENKEIDDKIKEIRTKVRKSMSGEVAALMLEHGINYKRNFGVEYPRIKEIAKDYDQNHDLAQRLWATKIREMMILAILLQPADKFTQEMAEDWLTEINQNELAEQVTMNLFSKLPYANKLALQCINSDKTWNQIVGFMLIGRIWESLDSEEIDKIVDLSIKLSDTEEYQLYKSISLALNRISRKANILIH